MSLPDRVPTPPHTRPDATTLTAILDAAAQHRLHAAMVLVGIHRVPAPVVLDLVWPDVQAAACEIRVPGLTVHLDPATLELLYLHGCRQRLDRRRAGPAWRHSLRLFVDQHGRAYTEANADEAVTIAAAKAGLPPVTLAEMSDLAARSTGTRLLKPSPEERRSRRAVGPGCR